MTYLQTRYIFLRLLNINLRQRKNLAHPIPIVRHNLATIVFVTFCTQPRGNHLDNDSFHAAFIDASQEANRWWIGRYVVMPDHIHLFCAPADPSELNVKRWCSYFKRCITIRLDRKAWRWQADCWDTQMRSRQHYEEKWAYVKINPERANLPGAQSWPYQGEINLLQW